ncbi:MAG: group II intron reverse transcriptase/maturase [Flavisolibacter sp.]|nr:group II intron reverse transcriptase/maturase [Flavisolibacter sp.]
MNEEKTKSFAVSKQMVYESYLKVCSKDGAAGIDKETIDTFNEDLSNNLYKVWNRMASGSYFPPAVRTVLIPKKQGGMRPLGIPTVGDRIAQGVVKDYLEPILEPLFHGSSFGYRPGRSAHHALEQCQHHCIQYGWVIDVDIKGFFDNISHEWMMKMISHHTQEKWVLLYTERWLKAGIERADGSIAVRTKGTPQGGVISPLLANLYLHHAFDMWMSRHFSDNPFERYADDIVVHCSNKAEAESLLMSICERLQVFGLDLHPEKTKLVYCKNYQRKEEHEHNSFTFLSYSFQPRARANKFGRHTKFMVFSPAICCKAKAFIREKIRAVFNPRDTTVSLEKTAAKMNPKLRGWLNYYSRYNKRIAATVFEYLNTLIRRWIEEKYRLRNKRKVLEAYQIQIQQDRKLFYHWQRGIVY